MFSSFSIFLVVLLYMVFLFVLALKAERNQVRLQSSYVWIYGLSLGVFHTSWAFYGNVGDAASYGFRYLAMDIGSYVCLALWFVMVKRMVQVKEAFRITSLADLVAARYNRSQVIAALVALIALLGSVPYVGLQIKAITDSMSVITTAGGDPMAGQLTGFAACAVLVLFTILFGIRRLDPTEHHYGMMVVLALECVIKLLALLAVGVFVTFGLNDGWQDLFGKIDEAGLNHLTGFGIETQGIASLLPQFIIGFFGVILLPRQFHLAVVENSSQRHIKPAADILAAYIALFSIFVVPIAGAGLLSGLPSDQADMFVLLLPLQQENYLLTLATFIGGFAAASGMVIITTTTVATMAANHLILPLAERWSGLAWMRTYLLQVRWLVALLLILSAYVFVTFVVNDSVLSALGTLSITALLQIMPAILGGLFWKRGNSRAALAAMVSGLVVWAYTLLLPMLVRDNGWSPDLLDYGPLGLELLRPEALFGVDMLDATTHAILFSLFINTLCYVVMSLAFDAHKQERTLTLEFMALFSPERAERKMRPAGLDDYIDFSQKTDEVFHLLTRYLRRDKAEILLRHVMRDLHVAERKQINILELVEFHRMIEHELAGSIGAASSHSAMQTHIHYSERESDDLKAIYRHIANEIQNRDSVAPEPQRRDQTIELLQTRITMLERDLKERGEEVDTLRDKLDARYEEIFRYRTENQRFREALKQQAALVAAEGNGSDIDDENRRLRELYAEVNAESEAQESDASSGEPEDKG